MKGFACPSCGGPGRPVNITAGTFTCDCGAVWQKTRLATQEHLDRELASWPRREWFERALITHLVDAELKRLKPLVVDEDAEEPMMVSTATVAYGFIRPEAWPSGPGWTTLVQRPFRPYRLFVWGEPGAVLKSFQIGHDEQLVQPVPFEAFPNYFAPEDVLRLFELNPTLPHQFEAERIDRLPRIEQFLFATASPGTALTLRYSGPVRGILIVGEQVK